MSDMPPDPQSAASPRPAGPRFRLVHLFYAVTLLAVSFGAFGAAGLAPGLWMLILWAVVFSPRLSRGEALLAGVLLVVSGLLILPALGGARQAARRMVCHNNLQQIAMALRAYHAEQGCFPPAYLAGPDGQPQHSWRVLILPYLQEQALHRAYRFDEPWDGPHNRRLLQRRPAVFACPSYRRTGGDAATHTNYMAVVDPVTAWPGDRGRRESEFRDGLSETILVVEASGGGIPWTSPRDLPLEKALRDLTSVAPDQPDGHHYEDYFSLAFAGRHVALADGRVRFMLGVDRDLWSGLLAVADGAGWPLSPSRSRVARPEKVKVANYARLGLWIMTALYPAPWAWRRKRNRTREVPTVPNRSDTC